MGSDFKALYEYQFLKGRLATNQAFDYDMLVLLSYQFLVGTLITIILINIITFFFPCQRVCQKKDLILKYAPQYIRGACSWLAVLYSLNFSM